MVQTTLVQSPSTAISFKSDPAKNDAAVTPHEQPAPTLHEQRATTPRSETGVSRSFAGRSLLRVTFYLAFALISQTFLAQHLNAELRKLALLVGVQEYQNLPANQQLRGAGNDVRILSSVLIDRFGFKPSEIVQLANDQATARSVRAALKRIVNRISESEPDSVPIQVVIYFSGHGSQILDQPPGHPDHDESDGLDETLVLYDSTKQGSETDIRDDELYEFANGVCANKQVRLWIILDCCHSGTGVRGATRVRQLDRDLRASVGSNAARIPGRKLPVNAVVLSACRDSEVEPEYQEGQLTYGLLTRFLSQVILETPRLSGLTYAALRQAIVNRYRTTQSVIQAPNPQLEGTGRDLQNVVLGANSVSDRPTVYEVRPDRLRRNRAVISAGAIHGVTSSSLYEVYKRPEEATEKGETSDRLRSKSIAWIKITEVKELTSVGTVLRPADGQESEFVESSFSQNFKLGFAVERHHEHESASLRIRIVKVQQDARDGQPFGIADPVMPAAIRNAVMQTKQPKDSNWLQVVGADAPCDVLIRFQGKFAAAFPGTGISSWQEPKARGNDPTPRALKGGWGPIDLTDVDKAGRQLRDMLRRIARARNLIRIAAIGVTKSGSTIDRKASLKCTLELLRVDKFDEDTFEIQKSRRLEVDPTYGTPVLKRGEYYAYRIRNVSTTGKPVHISVLHIDSDMKIEQVLPFQEVAGSAPQGEQRLESGESRMTDIFRCNGDEAHPVYGPRWAILIATASPNDFYVLSQPSLPRVRSGRGLSALDALFTEQLYFKTRGRRPRPRAKNPDSPWQTSVLQWRAIPR